MVISHIQGLVEILVLKCNGCSENIVFEFWRHGESHWVNCLRDSKACFECGNRGHKMRDCPLLTNEERDGR